MKVNIGKRAVPSKTRFQPPGLENPPPLKENPIDIMSGPKIHIPKMAHKISDTRFLSLPDIFRTIIKTRIVVIGRMAVSLITSGPENSFPRNQWTNTLGAQKARPPSNTYCSGFEMRLWFTAVSVPEAALIQCASFQAAPSTDSQVQINDLKIAVSIKGCSRRAIYMPRSMSLTITGASL